jgi:hypothetical protein
MAQLNSHGRNNISSTLQSSEIGFERINTYDASQGSKIARHMPLLNNNNGYQSDSRHGSTRKVGLPPKIKSGLTPQHQNT